MINSVELEQKSIQEVEKSKMRFFWIINALFVLEWIFLAFNVVNRGAWALENLLVFILVPIAVICYKKYFSRTSYLLLFIFVSLHLIGAHYTYSFVPYDALFDRIFGHSLNSILGWERNNYDRIVHFLWGLLLFLPLKELFNGRGSLSDSMRSLLAWLIVLATSTIYELLEFGAFVILNSSVGLAYTGAQGDIWDSQKDQLLAIIGASIAYGILKIKVPASFSGSRSYIFILIYWATLIHFMRQLNCGV